ncbi:uncharacterized protein SCHCODRAFT_02751169 [Schizophyllum commune H4-8]|uniref:Type II toxin-antitoxin system HicA family toxin n=1 Tax=Schizophyllum commune (strain H4-8 / FGSC 9210) TaxID=578458 RepID=D8QCN3_SCHCM|nr:uncharacterized protein SCHCODRAFT_02751169 [Schizophyllum commune H4-8]KAI5889658.1 hypothetical protein SCHCODRAFT_02751169 [Schizophyllum commune H4-8]
MSASTSTSTLSAALTLKAQQAREYMQQLVRVAKEDPDARDLQPVKWEEFVTLMDQLGFDYDPATPGTSVRFIPRNQRDQPVISHKPHPDPTIHPMMLREMLKKLIRLYGWADESEAVGAGEGATN